MGKAKSMEDILKGMNVLSPWWVRNSKVTLGKTAELCNHLESDSVPGCGHVYL